MSSSKEEEKQNATTKRRIESLTSVPPNKYDMAQGVDYFDQDILCLHRDNK